MILRLGNGRYFATRDEYGLCPGLVECFTAQHLMRLIETNPQPPDGVPLFTTGRTM